MSEEKDKKEVKDKTENKEPASDDAGEGVLKETVSELDRADQIAERQKRENDRREEILKREENLAARRAVGGGSEAGQPQEKKEETAKEYNDRIEKEISEGKHDDD